MYESSIMNGTRDVTATGAMETASRVSQDMSLVHKLLAENLELSSAVEQRLYAVLRPVGPSGENPSQGTPTPVLCPISSDLRSFASQLETIGARYRDILDRLEV